MRRDGTHQRNRTHHAALDRNPVFSPLQNRLAFVSDRAGNFEIYSMRWNGRKVVRLTDNPALDTIPDWGWFRPGFWARVR